MLVVVVVWMPSKIRTISFLKFYVIINLLSHYDLSVCECVCVCRCVFVCFFLFIKNALITINCSGINFNPNLISWQLRFNLVFVYSIFPFLAFKFLIQCFDHRIIIVHVYIVQFKINRFFFQFDNNTKPKLSWCKLRRVEFHLKLNSLSIDWFNVFLFLFFFSKCAIKN